MVAAHFVAYRLDNNRCCIYGKHPDGGVAGELLVFFQGGAHTGPENLHTPPGKAAQHIFFNHMIIVDVHHINIPGKNCYFPAASMVKVSTAGVPKVGVLMITCESKSSRNVYCDVHEIDEISPDIISIRPLPSVFMR